MWPKDFSTVMPTSSPAHLTHPVVSLSTVLFLARETIQFAPGSQICGASLPSNFANASPKPVARVELPINADPEALARYIAIIAWGLAVEAQSGAKRKDLYSAITAALAAWPATTAPRENGSLPTMRKSASTRRRQ